MRHLFVTLSLAVAAPIASAIAAQAPARIDPGMTRAQVVERFGRPSGERSAGTYTYLFYRNGCERACGTPDLVMLRDDAVVDAVIRSTARQYSGTSSSPATDASMRSPDTRAVGTEGVTERAPTTPASGGRMPGGSRGAIIEGRPGDGNLARDPAPTPGLSVRPRRQAPVSGESAAATSAGPERMNPRDSLSPRIDERATHEPHAADKQQERGTPAPQQRGLTPAPLSPAAPGVPAPAVTGVRPNPTDSARVARQRQLQRAGQPVRPDTTRRDTATMRPPND